MDTSPTAPRTCKAAIYARAQEVLQMADLQWLDSRFTVMERAISPDKVYLETHRDMRTVPEDDLRRISAYFREKGIQVAGGITITEDEGNQYKTFCYTNPEHRKFLAEIVELTARCFDEFILDDFFFTSCTCQGCVNAKGRRGWDEFRLDLLEKASLELILGPAKKVNPRVKVVVKFPNWYEHYQQCGLNLKAHVRNFDGIYTGTETRDPVRRGQHLQEYLGYSILRYLDNAALTGTCSNGGGWVDPAAMGSLDRYAEQVWMTVFGKAGEITFFDFRQLQTPITQDLKGPWQNGRTSFVFDTVLGKAQKDAAQPQEITIAYAAGDALATANRVAAKLGAPVGIPSYKPFHSCGEDFIHTYIGMLGIPVEMTPEYPENAPVVLLAESAAADPDLVDRIERSLVKGGQIIITGGLLRTLQAKGFGRIAGMEMTAQKALVKGFDVFPGINAAVEEPVLMSHLRFNTNASWEEVSGSGPYTGYPLLLRTSYGSGALYVLNLPDNWSDSYRLPVEALDKVREQLSVQLPVYFHGPGRIALMLYENRTGVLASFRDEVSEISVYGAESLTSLTDLVSGKTFTPVTEEPRVFWNREYLPRRKRFDVKLEPHSFIAFGYQ